VSRAVRPATASDRLAIAELLARRWGSTTAVSRGRVHDASRLPAFVCEEDGVLVGLATFELRGRDCELVTLDALPAGVGIGSALLAAVADEAARRGARRLWLVTTNDNLDALRFYQRRGLRLVAVHRDALAASRRLKPSIPELGAHAIPLRDELELELRLDEPGDAPGRATRPDAG
jgi:N-acetylglutamate synthase-like GNAT family acetyltransferase